MGTFRCVFQKAYIFEERGNRTGVERLDKSVGRQSWWVIIGPDAIRQHDTGAFDLASFLKRRLALAVSITR